MRTTSPAAPLRVMSPRWIAFAIGCVILVALYGSPLIELGRFALSHDFYSYILLIPVVSGYLVWTSRQSLPPTSTPNWLAASVLIGSGALIAAGCVIKLHVLTTWPESDYLCLVVLSLWCLFAGLCAATMGQAKLKAMSFPLFFLFFAVPMPQFMYRAAEILLQKASADISHFMIEAVGTPVWREGMVMHLPGINIEVAPECCGIHSTLVLFITSVLAGHLFLSSGSRKLLLVAAVLPIALLRNGVRIFTLSELSVHISPAVMDSPLHHHGGPLFFALSLIPFLALLQALRRRELRSPVLRTD